MVGQNRGTSPFCRHSQTQHPLVVVETALALVLLTGAGLLLNSLWRLTRVDLGFASEGLVAFQVALAEARYPEPPQRYAFYDDMLDRLPRLPGVQSGSI